jgi:cation-transporting ATPase 13A3/4/5
VPFHVASEQFNRENPENPVWQEYQAEGGEPSPAMSRELRLTLWLVCLAGMVAVLAWEYFVVFGQLGKWFAQWLFPKQTVTSERKVVFDSF